MFCKHSSPLRHNMRVSRADATSFGVMVGVGETYLPAFALAIGLGEVTAGLVGSLPLLLGGLLQAVSPWILRRGVSEQLWVVGASVVQGCAFIPLIVAALWGEMSTLGLMLAASLYWAGGLAGSPAWNSWIDKLIPKPIRANYFASRTRSAQIATACGFLIAGGLLHGSRNGGWELQAFAALFTVAWLARTCSVCMLALHRSSPARTAQRLTTSVSPTASPALASSTVRPVISATSLVVYLALVQGVVQISGPFFTPYMLKHLEMSYLGFAVLIATAFVAKIVALATWGKLAKRRGAQWLLLIGGLLIIPAPSLWIVSSSYGWLLLVQTLSGVAWAAYELGFFLQLFESVPIVRRVRYLTIYNLANSAAWCGGALVGACLLHYLGASAVGYYTLFAVSTVGRGLALAFLVSRCAGTTAALQETGWRLLSMATVRPRTPATVTDPRLAATHRKPSEDLAA